MKAKNQAKGIQVPRDDSKMNKQTKNDYKSGDKIKLLPVNNGNQSQVCRLDNLRDKPMQKIQLMDKKGKIQFCTNPVDKPMKEQQARPILSQDSNKKEKAD